MLACLRLAISRLPLEFDFKKSRPKFSGHEQSIPCRIERDAVQPGSGTLHAAGGQQATQIDPSRNTAGLCIYCRNTIVVPDVSVDFTVDVLEFVQLFDGQLAIHDCDEI